MKTELFVISCAKHFNHLCYALRSIQKFARGFSRCRVLIPRSDMGQFDSIVFVFPPKFGEGEIPIQVEGFDEWPGQGMLHICAIMCSDQYCPEADVIMHFDSDWVFTDPVTPEDFMVDGNQSSVRHLRLALQHCAGEFKDVAGCHGDAIGKPVPFETIRWPRLLYRDFIRQLGRKSSCTPARA
jgi:hypothetical protein